MIVVYLCMECRPGDFRLFDTVRSLLGAILHGFYEDSFIRSGTGNGHGNGVPVGPEEKY